jgi:hypothetical protein
MFQQKLCHGQGAIQQLLCISTSDARLYCVTSLMGQQTTLKHKKYENHKRQFLASHHLHKIQGYTKYYKPSTSQMKKIYYNFKTSASLKYSAHVSFTTSILCIKIMPIFLVGSQDLFLVPLWLVCSQYLAFPFYHIPQVNWLYKTQK